jgi:16S rRNA (adenine1518-N6/adenine1519-N6)-dimethyltransferase
MVQKEVGERLCAAPGSKTYGALTVGVGLNCEIAPVFEISEHSFKPPPKVKSMVVKLRRRLEPLFHDIALAQRVIQAAFQQRRKKILNALTQGLSLDKKIIEEVLKESGVSPMARAEVVSLEQFVNMFNVIAREHFSATEEIPFR